MFDVIIVGAGITGLSAAWYLTEKMKKRVLLLEQFEFPNKFGSSIGFSRITRQLYEEPINCILMKEATDLWRELEKKSAMSLFIQNGLILFGSSDDMKSYFEAIDKTGLAAHRISHEEARRQFPLFNIRDDWDIIYDPIAGVLKPNKCLEALMTLSLENGLDFRQKEKVLDISVESKNEVKIVTTKSEYKASAVILATGTWCQQLLRKMKCDPPLQPVQINYAFFKPKESNVCFNYETIPSFILAKGHTYGLYESEHANYLKIGDFSSDDINPDGQRSEGPSKNIYTKNMIKFLSSFIPSADVSPCDITQCVITRTPDFQPIIDRHQIFSNVIIGCGFNGCGFKTGIIHGKILGDLALNNDIKYDISCFSVSRFFEKP